MQIKFRCPACNHKLRAESAHAGRRAACSKCRQPVTVPAASTANGDDKAASDAIEPLESGSAVALVAAEPDTQPPPAPPPAQGHAPAIFITFNCPGCGKRVGFPANLPGTPAKCPACQLTVMIPDKSGGESFIIGDAAPHGAAPHAPRPSTGEGAAELAQATHAELAQATRVTPPSKEAAPHPQPEKANNGGAAAVPKPPAPSHVPHAARLGATGERHPVSRRLEPASGPLRGDARRRLPLWALLLIGLALLAAIAVGGPWLQRLLGGIGRTRAPASTASEPRVSASDDGRSPAATPAPAVAELAMDKPPVAGLREDGPDQEPPAVAVTPPDPLEPVEIRLAPNAGPAVRTDLGEVLTLRDRKQNRDEDDIEEPPPKTKKSPAPAAAAAPAGGGSFLEKQLDKLAGPKDEMTPGEPAAVAPEAEPVIMARPAAAPLACEKCLGTHFVPRAPFVPYVFVERETPSPAAAVPWLYCPQCQGGQENAGLAQAEAERLKTVLAAHRKLADQAHQAMTYAETHHVALHAQLPDGSLRRVGETLERLAAHLEQTTQSTALCQTRPATHDLVIFSDVQGYLSFRGARGRRSETEERHKQSFTVGPGLPPAENMALFRLGRMFMAEASDGKAPAWLMEGFAAYCENAVLHRNLCCPQSASRDEVKPGENWDAALKRLATQGKLPQFERLSSANRGNMSPNDYAASCSLVTFLFKTNPRDFVRFVFEIRGGALTPQALERVYGRNTKEVQAAWAQWVAAR